MQLTVASRSSTGPVRNNNEDFLTFWEPADIDERRGRGAIAIIADGVGGHDNGEVASRLAVETALTTFQRSKPGASLSSAMWQLVNEANVAVYDSAHKDQVSPTPMQTTLTAVVFRNDQIGIAHVGDCRVYHIHQNIAKCLTKDHIFSRGPAQLSASSPLRGGLTRSIGKDPIVTIDFNYYPVYDNDYIVLCTDGVHVYVTEGEFTEIVTHNPPEKACDILVQLAETRGTQDNLTIQICRIDQTQSVQYYRGIPVYREKVQMSQELKVGSVLDDRFEITCLISRSGMASIFQATDRTNNQQVALKVPFMQYESDPAFFSRFQREEEIGKALSHPGILKIVDLPPDFKSRPYIAMELLRGKTLDEIMRNERPMNIPKAVNIVATICDSLAYMHSKNIVHRDLKPANIMICDDGSIRIMDFGIAKAEGMRRITFTGLSPAMGTPDYMAPEQVKGRRGDHRTDIYSLGAILYELVTGHPPFEADNPFLIMQARVTGDPEAPTNFNHDITPALEEIILHAMDREPRNRYNSADEMSRDLRDQDHVTLTGRVNRLQKPKFGASKWRSIGGIVALALLPILIFIIIFLIFRGHR